MLKGIVMAFLEQKPQLFRQGRQRVSSLTPCQEPRQKQKNKDPGGSRDIFFDVCRNLDQTAPPNNPSTRLPVNSLTCI